MPTKNPPKDDAAQSAAFIEKARELEADGDESEADKLMGKLAKMKLKCYRSNSELVN